MTARTHDLGAAVLVSYYFLSQPLNINWETGLGIGLATVIGALIPDIDNVASPAWKNKLTPWEGKASRDLLQGHRHLSHSLIGVFLFNFCFGWLFMILKLPHLDTFYINRAFFISYLSHLLLDSLTLEGVPWFYPLPFKFGFPPFKFLRIKTGGMIEKIFIFPGLLISLIWIYYLFRENLIIIFGGK